MLSNFVYLFNYCQRMAINPLIPIVRNVNKKPWTLYSNKVTRYALQLRELSFNPCTQPRKPMPVSIVRLHLVQSSKVTYSHIDQSCNLINNDQCKVLNQVIVVLHGGPKSTTGPKFHINFSLGDHCFRGLLIPSTNFFKVLGWFIN